MKREYYGIIDSREVEINLNELARRLGGLPDPEEAVYDECREALLRAAVCRYAFVKTDLCLEEGRCDFGSFRVVSRDLRKNLADCGEAWLMGVTIGPGVDRLLAGLALRSPAKHFITDAYASALVEALADKAEEEILKKEEEGRSFRPRYSPGYGDCKIETQRDLLEKLRAAERLGISLDEACFMKPVKSITAVIGVCRQNRTKKERRKGE